MMSPPSFSGFQLLHPPLWVAGAMSSLHKAPRPAAQQCTAEAGEEVEQHGPVLGLPRRR